MQNLFIALAMLLSLLVVPVAPAQTYTTIKSFGILTNISGFQPLSQLVQGAGGTLYGTASAGEGHVLGTVFKLQPDGSGFTVLKRFTNSADGAFLNAGLTLSGSTLYGTTVTGGSSSNGTVFKVNTDGSGFAVLYSFTGGSNGAFPYAGLTLSGSTLYGTTEYGGSSGQGTVFKMNTDGSGYAVLHSFTAGSDGAYPDADLVLSGSTLYGTTTVGGSSGGDGAVFKVNTDGTGFTVLYSFTGGSDGALPYAGVTLSGGTFYGTTEFGGSSGQGTVFKVNTNGTGFAVLYSFTGGNDGARPRAGLTLSGSTLYGSTQYGGGSGQGTVFKVNTDGSSFTAWQEFTYSDATYPQAVLTLSGNTLYPGYFTRRLVIRYFWRGRGGFVALGGSLSPK